MAAKRGRRRKGYAYGRTDRRRSAASDNRGVVRLVICGGIFVSLVLMKLLFPEMIGGLKESTQALIGRDADFRAAFAAIGRAAGGEEPVGDSLRDVYTAVFALEEDEAAEPVSVQEEPALPVWGETVTMLRHVTPTLPENREITYSVDTETVKESDNTDAEKTEYMIPETPENASMELRNLGFAYTSPLVGKLTSAFGWREHPVEGGDKFHYGIDLSGNMGDPVYAFADGKVFATGESSTLGQYIMVQHAGGYMTLYAHCSKVTKLSGAVKKGEKIAQVGDSGVATGPHLHFELQCGSVYLNPIYYVELASY